MAFFRRSTLTTKGLEILSASQSGGNITFTRMEVGDGLPVDDPVSMTALRHTVRSYGIEGYTNNGTDFAAWTTIGSEGNAQGYYLREQGLFVANPDSPEDRSTDILYAVSVVMPDTGGRDYVVYVPPADGPSAVGWRVEMHTVVASTAQIEVNVGVPTDYATLQDLSAYTPLSTFKPVVRNDQIYGGHRHIITDIDGLQTALDDLSKRIDLLREILATNIIDNIEFRMTFWTLDGVIVNDGQWIPESGSMSA